MSEYLLPRHVFFCGTGHTIVFLDLKRDEYTMIRGRETHAFLALASFHTSTSHGDGLEHSTISADEQARATRDLLAAGLLTTDLAQGKPIMPTAVDAPAEHLIEDSQNISITLRASHICAFVVSCVRAWLHLRFWSIQRSVSYVQQRKQAHGTRVCKAVDETRALVCAFNRLRSLFPADYLCLFDSLALIEFLAIYGIFPTWVFGVKVDSWSAHCWVQDGTTIYNEDIEEAEDYIPIMVV
jgi:hypothetical protein